MAYRPKFKITEPPDNGRIWRTLVNRGPTSLRIDPNAGIVKGVNAGTGQAIGVHDVTFHE